MKILITENKLKGFIKSKFNLDLTNKVKMITSSHENRYVFNNMIEDYAMRSYLNEWGPVYIFFLRDETFLVQPRGNSSFFILSSDGVPHGEKYFFKKLGIPPIISINDLIDMYVEEEE